MYYMYYMYQSTLCLFVLLYSVNILSTVVNNHFEQINDDNDDDNKAVTS